VHMIVLTNAITPIMNNFSEEPVRTVEPGINPAACVVALVSIGGHLDAGDVGNNPLHVKILHH
jgi:hypothetical protein